VGFSTEGVDHRLEGGGLIALSRLRLSALTIAAHGSGREPCSDIPKRADHRRSRLRCSSSGKFIGPSPNWISDPINAAADMVVPCELPACSRYFWAFLRERCRRQRRCIGSGTHRKSFSQERIYHKIVLRLWARSIRTPSRCTGFVRRLSPLNINVARFDVFPSNRQRIISSSPSARRIATSADESHPLNSAAPLATILNDVFTFSVGGAFLKLHCLFAYNTAQETY
jgi:hypothetical protein